MKKIYLAIVAFLFVFQATPAQSVVRTFLKVECIPEFNMLEIRTIKYDEPYRDDYQSFIDKTEVYDSEEAKYINDKYNMIVEVNHFPGEGFYKINRLDRKCVLEGEEYNIIIGRFGIDIFKGKVEPNNYIVSSLFFDNDWDWEIYSLQYNAFSGKIWVNAKLDTFAPIEYFMFSTEDGAVLSRETMDRKRAEYLKEVEARKASGKCIYETIDGINDMPSLGAELNDERRWRRR